MNRVTQYDIDAADTIERIYGVKVDPRFIAYLIVKRWLADFIDWLDEIKPNV